MNDVPAEGLEYIEAYDNGSYLSPMLYAIDILNLLEGVASLGEIDWDVWRASGVKADTSRIFLTSHSQGGDAAATAMAVSSSPKMMTSFAAGSIFSERFSTACHSLITTGMQCAGAPSNGATHDPHRGLIGSCHEPLHSTARHFGSAGHSVYNYFPDNL
ncbi:MAG: hypothetical protein GY801_16405 [bacterium]|nr:hypothetical protein [bacterium]